MIEHKYTLVLEESPTPEETDFVRRQLDAFNHLYTEPDNYSPLNVFLRDDKQTIVAGLLGETYWGWLQCQHFVGC